MAASFVLIHSPSVGPRTWQPVAHRLTALGWEAAVPSLLHVTDHGPPYWPHVVEAVRAGLGTAYRPRGRTGSGTCAWHAGSRTGRAPR